MQDYVWKPSIFQTPLNNKRFPSALLRPGEKYEAEIIFKLSHK